MTILTLLILGLMAAVAVALVVIGFLVLLERLVWRPRQEEALRRARSGWDDWV